MADEVTQEMAGENPPMNLGGAITEKVMENIKTMDIASVLKKLVESSSADEEGEAARVKLEEVLSNFNAMTEDEQGHFADKIKSVLATRISGKLQERMSGIEEDIQQAIVSRVLFVGVGILILILVFVFFGYKLYKSIKDKEVKREEKKKAKQMKKKK